MTLGAILVTLIGGIIIGLLGKFVAPGDRDNIPLWLTIVCGIGGMFLGTFLYGACSAATSTRGVDWCATLCRSLAAAVLVMIAATRRPGARHASDAAPGHRGLRRRGRAPPSAWCGSRSAG